jgi:hypothetical protein
MTSETYPNGMCTNYTYNSVGEAAGIEYIKTTNCSESKPTVWYSESAMSSIRGQMLSQESTLGSESYAYDTAERLTETQETPTGEGCKTRVYAYDEESNRTNLTTREPNSKKECASEGGAVEKHTYDEANRLIDTGVEYDPLGNTTKLPAADAGEGGELKSTFYVDNEVATQNQNGETISYEPDPTGRVRRTVSEGKTASTVISHYDAPGEAIAWKSEGSEKWTRDIPGIDGTLSAVESSGSSAVLQLHDLQGDTVATAALSSSETKLLSTYNSTEFGVPNTGKPPPKYAFQGAGGATSELGTGIITYGATSYVPQTGRTLQSEEVEPPGAPGGSGAGAPYTFQEEPWVMQGATREADEAPGLEAGREREAAEAACRANPASCGGIDPPHILVLFTPAEAIGYGEVLCDCSVVKGASQAIESIADKIGAGGLGELFEEFMESGAAEGLGKELLSCGRYLNSNSRNRCALEINTWEFLGHDTYIPTSIHIGACFYFKKSFERKKRGLNCTDGKYYKPGSY